ncbi:MAG: hypothetical protein WBB34_12305 [Xanthobacteraceae bacterium]
MIPTPRSERTLSIGTIVDEMESSGRREKNMSKQINAYQASALCRTSGKVALTLFVGVTQAGAEAVQATVRGHWAKSRGGRCYKNSEPIQSSFIQPSLRGRLDF